MTVTTLVFSRVFAYFTRGLRQISDLIKAHCTKPCAFRVVVVFPSLPDHLTLYVTEKVPLKLKKDCLVCGYRVL